ncbi:MAG: hypothetical protein LLG20_14380 [Acidobacteriales bacterium]|nr:hypothetical protein [Terriglobales bacterium]
MADVPSVFPAPAVAVKNAPRARSAVRSHWWLPSLSDCFFIAVLVWLFAAGSGGWTALLADGDAGWHIRTGEYILDHGAVPKTDFFSYSKPGQPWYAWEWLSDVCMALLHRAWGLQALVLVAGLLIAATSTLLLWDVFRRGANTFVALVAVLLAVGSSSVHYLARPHLVTLLLVTFSMWMLGRDRQVPSPWIWCLVPLSALWANMHGGFLALIACVGLMAAGTAVEAFLHGDSPRLYGAGRYTLLAGACSLATLANPYGVELHVHIASYLRSDWIRELVQEFQAPRFRSENLLQFEILLFLGIMCVGSLLARKQIVEVLWVLFWGHQALNSARHVPIFAVVAAPVVACELTRLWDRWTASASRSSLRGILSSLAADSAPGFRRVSFWPLAVVVLLIVATPAGRWPQDFPTQRFPVSMVTRHAETLKHGRVFTSDQWADYLIYRFYPSQKVFFDGRSDFYGPQIGDQYLHLYQGRYDWDAILERNRIDVVLCPVEWPLASLLKRDAGWRLVEDGGATLLFERRAGDVPGAAAADPGPSVETVLSHPDGLMKHPEPAEREKGRFEATMSTARASRGGDSMRTSMPADEVESPFQETALAGGWRLPQGQTLPEFALESGFLAPQLLELDSQIRPLDGLRAGRRGGVRR